MSSNIEKDMISNILDALSNPRLDILFISTDYENKRSKII